MTLCNENEAKQGDVMDFFLIMRGMKKLKKIIHIVGFQRKFNEIFIQSIGAFSMVRIVQYQYENWM